MFVGKAGACPSEAPKVPAKDQHSLLNYSHEKFYNIGPWYCTNMEVVEDPRVTIIATLVVRSVRFLLNSAFPLACFN
jgi:hypothetical protein